MTKTPEYRTWQSMKRRCYNPRARGYDNYGGRGIRICDEWLHSFVSFYAYIGPKANAQCSIERIDVNGHYEPGNVRWATDIEQANNTRVNHRLTYKGETHTIAEWSRILDINRYLIKDRLLWGWSTEDALKTPVSTINQSVTINGKSQSITAWCAELKISAETVRVRIWKGASPSDALLTPVQKYDITTYLFHGSERSIADISRMTGINKQTIRDRLATGEPIERAADPDYVSPYRRRGKTA